jgi:hypothetical protein
MQPILRQLAQDAYVALGGSGYGRYTLALYFLIFLLPGSSFYHTKINNKNFSHDRVDIRSDAMDSQNVFVLEVNANCGVSFNVNEFTSTVGEVLLHHNVIWL